LIRRERGKRLRLTGPAKGKIKGEQTVQGRPLSGNRAREGENQGSLIIKSREGAFATEREESS